MTSLFLPRHPSPRVARRVAAARLEVWAMRRGSRAAVAAASGASAAGALGASASARLAVLEALVRRAEGDRTAPPATKLLPAAWAATDDAVRAVALAGPRPRPLVAR